MTRLDGSNAASWDARNRMTAYVNGDPETQTVWIAERYVYDATSYRIVRFPEAGDGRPVVAIRDASGQLMAEFRPEPTATAQPALHKDYLYGVGQLLVERRAADYVPPEIEANSTLELNGDYGIKLTGGPSYVSYTVDVRTHAGIVSQVAGLVPDAQGVLWVPESVFELDATNFVRVRGEGTGEPEPYSQPITILIDSTVTPASPNQIRAMSVSRSGTDLVLVWDLLQANGQSTYLYFDRADGSGQVQLTLVGLPPGTPMFPVPEQALNSPCGSFYSTANSASGPASMPTESPSPGGSMNLAPNEPTCNEDPPPEPTGYRFADSFHHRDHLGSLRVVTDAGGMKVAAHDFYPFGTEVGAGSHGGGSRKRYTGHERDEQTGLDYMLARYCGASLGSFLGPDRIGGSPISSQSWNKYSYVDQNPIRWIDPDGLKKMDPSVRGFLEAVFQRDLSRVRVHHNVVSKFILFVTPRKQSAITLGRRIFYSKGAWDDYLAKNKTGIGITGHETVHANQFRDIGFIKFAAKYLLESVKHGTGQGNQYEAPAYDVGTRIEALLTANPDILLAIQQGTPLTEEQEEAIAAAFPEFAPAEDEQTTEESEQQPELPNVYYDLTFDYDLTLNQPDVYFY